MSEGVVWEFRLSDKMSGPAKGIRAEIVRMQRDAERAASKQERAFAKAAREAQKSASAQARAAASVTRAQRAAVQQQARALAMLNNAIARDGLRAYRDRERAAAASLRREQANSVRFERALARQQLQAQRRAGRGGAPNGIFGPNGFLRAAGDASNVISGVLTPMLGIVGDIASGFLSVSANVGEEALEMASFQQSSMATLDVLNNGDHAATMRQFGNAISLANLTPADTTDVVARQTALAAAGFGENQQTPLLAAISDIQAAHGNQQADVLQDLLSRMQSSGSMSGRDLRSLTAARVNQGMVLDNLAQQLGITGDETSRRAAVQGAISHHRVTAAMGVSATEGAINQQYDRGQGLGTQAVAQSHTLTGALSNVRNAVPNLFLGIDSGQVQGVQALSRAIVTVTDSLGVASPLGRELQGAMRDLMDSAGRALSPLINTQNLTTGVRLLEGAMRGVSTALQIAAPLAQALFSGFSAGFAGMEALSTASSALTDLSNPGHAQAIADLQKTFHDLGVSLGVVASTIADIARHIDVVIAVTRLGASVATMDVAGIARAGSQLYQSQTPAAAQPGGHGLLRTAASFVTGGIDLVGMYQQYQSAGQQAAAGLAAGMAQGAPTANAAAASLAQGTVSTAQQNLQVHSPSRVFAEIGAHVAEGFAMGVDGGASGVADAVSSLVRPPAMSLGGGRAGGVSIVVHVTGGSSPEATGEAVADALEERLGDIFDRFASAAGV